MSPARQLEDSRSALDLHNLHDAISRGRIIEMGPLRNSKPHSSPENESWTTAQILSLLVIE